MNSKYTEEPSARQQTRQLKSEKYRREAWDPRQGKDAEELRPKKPTMKSQPQPQQKSSSNTESFKRKCQKKKGGGGVQ